MRNVELRRSPENRFWDKVNKSDDGCWLWTGAVTTTGYGVFQRGRRGERLHKAHRFSYELHFGRIPDGRLVLHSCDNKTCVNPAHLSIGDHSRNIKEAWSRGRRKPSKWNLEGFPSNRKPNPRLDLTDVADEFKDPASLP